MIVIIITLQWYRLIRYFLNNSFFLFFSFNNPLLSISSIIKYILWLTISFNKIIYKIVIFNVIVWRLKHWLRSTWKEANETPKKSQITVERQLTIHRITGSMKEGKLKRKCTGKLGGGDKGRKGESLGPTWKS